MMTRENKAGLVVSGSFICLLAVVLVNSLRKHDEAKGPAEEQIAAAQIPPDPTRIDDPKGGGPPAAPASNPTEATTTALPRANGTSEINPSSIASGSPGGEAPPPAPIVPPTLSMNNAGGIPPVVESPQPKPPTETNTVGDLNAKAAPELKGSPTVLPVAGAEDKKTADVSSVPGFPGPPAAPAPVPSATTPPSLAGGPASPTPALPDSKLLAGLPLPGQAATGPGLSAATPKTEPPPAVTSVPPTLPGSAPPVAAVQVDPLAAPPLPAPTGVPSFDNKGPTSIDDSVAKTLAEQKKKAQEAAAPLGPLTPPAAASPQPFAPPAVANDATKTPDVALGEAKAAPLVAGSNGAASGRLVPEPVNPLPPLSPTERPASGFGPSQVNPSPAPSPSLGTGFQSSGSDPFLPVVKPIKDSAMVPAGGFGVPPQPLARVDAYDEEVHRCGPTDTYRSISQNLYESDKYERALMLHNQKRSGMGGNGPAEPRAGQIVYVPPIRILEREFPDAIPATPTAAPVRAATPDRNSTRPSDFPPSRSGPTASPSGFKTYRVQGKEEHLREIARKTLNDSERWFDIHKLNPRLPSGFLPGGTEVVLPRDANVGLPDQPPQG